MSNDFDDFIRKRRSGSFPSNFDSVYLEFIGLEFHNKNPDFFFENASEIVENLRQRNWDAFLKREKQFSIEIYKDIVREDVETLEPREAVEDYINQNVDNFYALSLSNTQSRRSRAGGEFEAIISHLFMGADLPFDEQGLIGADFFTDRTLAKLVDHVVPGAVEYINNKRNTIAISAKTTLRERWQQIGDEMQRTRMPEIYLATLDTSISENTLIRLRNNNIYPVTTIGIKQNYYEGVNLVITFEDLLSIGLQKKQQWEKKRYSEEDINIKISLINKALQQHADKPFVVNYLNRRLKFFQS